MPTAMNTTVKVYKGVPLIKGGTEVLYLAQGSAEGVLSAYLHKTYTEYYYTRENRGAIQVHDIIPNLEGCNYVSFANMSHGGKIFFGFIDQLVYINDNNTEIHFTIDPFPTYLGDCTERQDVFVIRNTPKPDSDKLIAEDFDFQGRPYMFDRLAFVDLPLGKTITVFTPGRLVNEQGTLVVETDGLGSPLSMYGFDTGLRYQVNMPASAVKLVTQAGGSILGVYAIDNVFDPSNPISSALTGTITTIGNHEKLKTGQYNKISIVAAGKAKSYDLNKFTNRQTINFYVKRYIAPVPMLAIYPLDYEGVSENTAQALILEYPMLATATSNYFSANTAIENLRAGLKGFSKEAGRAEFFGQKWDSFDYYNRGDVEVRNGRSYVPASKATSFNLNPSSVSELLANAGALARGIKGSMEDGEINTSAGGLVLTNNNSIRVELFQTRHNSVDITALDDYFDYYGYAFNQFMTPNLDDKAYLQVGSEFLSGSEVDVLLNRYLMHGIKIKKSLP